MNERLELSRPRDTTALFRDSLRVYRRHFGTFLALAAIVVVPATVIVEGIGLEQLSSSYDSSPGAAELIIPVAVAYLVIAPLMNAVCIHALRSIAHGEQPGTRASAAKGFEAFTPLFLAVLLAAAGIALGLLLLVLPGIYLAVRWFFVPQEVVLEGARGVDALQASSRVVRGSWWRTAGLVVLANLAALLPVMLLTTPLAAVAESTDRAVWALLASTLTQMLTTPFVALFATLLWYDLRARRAPARL
ncbi:MAG TPA: hypothetical protein VEQ61_10115 [Thermoleophilaceae bacterium]|nr:hypothetical protein [Thermoleophilaceae bacterium]